VHIPKEKGKTCPLGISPIEDKIVQQALREVLEAIYEQDFLSCSYGYRPGRSAHDALHALDRAAMRGEMNWVLEADVKAFFDSLDRSKLKEMLRRWVADESLIRLVGKCLQAGVLDGEEYSAVLYGRLRRHRGEVFRRLAEQRESRVEERRLMVDHVHMLLRIPPKHAVSHVAGYIKGKSAIHLALGTAA